MPTKNSTEERHRQQEAETTLLAQGVYLVKRLKFNGRCLVRTADDTTLLLDYDHYMGLPHLDSPPIGVVWDAQAGRGWVRVGRG